MSEWNFGNAIAEEASEQLRERVREAEAERDRAIERTSSLVEALAQQWADRSKAMGERDEALAEVARGLKRDEALGKIAKQSCNCGEYDQHEVSCPTLIAREALKEG